MNSIEEREQYSRSPRQAAKEKELIGTVEGFFSKINVVAIKLSSPLKVGETIEIGDEESSVKQKILSMQIDRQDVMEAAAGDSVGIKLNYKVAEGSSVYRL
ncbi:MAG: translation elongation factor-like protein [Candidatus Micrarchaeota archaeon]|nr:translation elongation factor-like protein [Candidatus Micrarchaeota archaeon]